jgi:3-phenylpropionate/trans-cinnamate dioxygenase ferredoxin component
VKVRLGSSADVAEGAMKAFIVDWERILVARIDGKLFAVDDTCSHAEASLSSGHRDGYEVRCPLHGARFDLRTGDVLSLPAAAPLQAYKVFEEAGSVFVVMDDD